MNSNRIKKQVVAPYKQWCFFKYDITINTTTETKESLYNKLIRFNRLLSNYCSTNKYGIEFFIFTKPNEDFLDIEHFANNIINNIVDISDKVKLTLTNDFLEVVFKSDATITYTIDDFKKVVVEQAKLEDQFNLFNSKNMYSHILQSLTKVGLDCIDIHNDINIETAADIVKHIYTDFSENPNNYIEEKYEQ